MITVLLPLSIIVSIVGFVFIFAWFDGAFENAGGARADHRAYSSLETGFELAQVERLFGRPSDYTCRIDSLTVHYFFNDYHVTEESIEARANEAEFPDSVETLEDLPTQYSAKQILVDSDRRVVAFTHVGEELNVHTILGDFPRARLNELPDNFLGALESQE